MSTAQETLADAAGTTNPDVDAGAQTAQTPAPPATPRAAADVEYLIFEEARTDTWTQLGPARAKSPELALETLGEQKLKAAQGRFMVVPTRYVTQKKPNVTTQTIIAWD